MAAFYFGAYRAQRFVCWHISLIAGVGVFGDGVAEVGLEDPVDVRGAVAREARDLVEIAVAPAALVDVDHDQAHDLLRAELGFRAWHDRDLIRIRVPEPGHFGQEIVDRAERLDDRGRAGSLFRRLSGNPAGISLRGRGFAVLSFGHA